MNARFLLLAATAVTFAACKKERTINPVPFIYFENMAPDKLQASSPKDTLFITFKVTDEDGDLGNDITSNNHDVYLVDTRINQVNRFFFPNIPTDVIDPQLGISAHCTIKVSSALFLQLRTDTQHLNNDTLRYKIYVKDRAGHVSDTITTPEIYLFR